MEAGVGNLKLFDFSDIAGASLEQKIDYSMTNIAAFLAQAMHETIRYDACDENNWDHNYPDALYRSSAACGQLEQDYQAYHCSDDGTGINYECEVDPNMELMGTTHALWYGAPPPMFCAPKSKLATAPLWSTYGDSCWGVEPTVPESVDEIISLLHSDNGCWGYEGMKGGSYSLVSEELAEWRREMISSTDSGTVGSTPQQESPYVDQRGAVANLDLGAQNIGGGAPYHKA